MIEDSDQDLATIHEMSEKRKNRATGIIVVAYCRRQPYEPRCGATRSINSRDEIIFVFFQNFGKCRWLPVTR